MLGKKTVDSVMSRDVETVNPSDTLRDAAEQMRALNVGAMPVCDGNRLVGMVTDRDIVVRAVALGHNPESAKVSEVMSDEVAWIKRDASIDEAAKMMKDRQIRRLLVIDEDKKLVGIVSLGDLSQEASDRLAGETLEAISEPSVPQI